MPRTERGTPPPYGQESEINVTGKLRHTGIQIGVTGEITGLRPLEHEANRVRAPGARPPAAVVRSRRCAQLDAGEIGLLARGQLLDAGDSVT
jgi:hypothetical protein